ncbi:hypothetical protein CKO25_16230 [Thiocapsa imhoffii]|uniref:Uncharacterized protein n=1 Tax=Thiocapsa imhoffii TaxID=382777 RepID=A0A9X0WKP9_9GAMM|nr:hypothetical protein [Thiocapsa imhoffii]
MKARQVAVSALTILVMTGGQALAAPASIRSCSVAAYEFFWAGQFAGFMVNGRFSYNENAVPTSGIVREEDLLAFDVSFYDPQGNLLRTYPDNHKFPVDGHGVPYLNVAFDTITQQLLQTGTWNVDDDVLRFRNGFMMGEGNPDLRGQPGSQTGLAFWTRPRDNAVPHLHVDDWNDDFGFPIGFSSHEDASFPTRTTQERIDTGRVGEAYYLQQNGTVLVNNLASDVGEFGQWVRVTRAKASPLDLRDHRRCLIQQFGRPR